MLKIQSNVSHSCMQNAWRGCKVDMLMINQNRNTREPYMLTCHHRCWIPHTLLAYGSWDDSRMYWLYAWYVHIWNRLNNLMIHRHRPLKKLRIGRRYAGSITHPFKFIVSNKHGTLNIINEKSATYLIVVLYCEASPGVSQVQTGCF